MAGATVPELATQSDPVVGTDLFVSYRAPGPLKSVSATAILSYVEAPFSLSSGSSLVGAIQSGTGAQAETVQAALRRFIFVSQFGADGGSAAGDDSVGIAAAITEATARGGAVVKGVPGVTYYLNAIVTVPDNVILDFTGCTVRCTTGSTQTHFFTINGDNSGILGCAFIGTGQVAPSAAYSSGTYNGTAIYVTGGSTNVLIEKCTFTNFQSGPILCYGSSSSALAADKLIVSKCIFTNVQIYTGHQTSSVIGFHRCDNSLMVDCVCTTYNWKCFYAANSTNSGSVRCYAIGGSGNSFDSSHHIVGDPGGLYTDCFHFDGVHSGAGAGAKLDRATRGILANFRSTGQFGAIIQDSKDFSLVNCKFWGVPASSTYAYAAITATTGESCYGQFIGCTAQWSGTPVVGNTGFLFGNNAASTTFGPIRVSSCRVLNPYWGVSIPDDGLAKAVFIDNTYLMDCQQYGIIAWAGDLKVSGGEIRMTSATAQSAIFVAQDGVTTTGDVVIDGVKFSGSTIRRNIEFGGALRLAYRLMALRNCDFVGGTRPIEFLGNADAADVVSLLVIEDNTGTGFTTGGLSLTFNTTTATKARVRNNSFMDASFVPVADTYTNLANVIWLEDMAYAGTPEAVFYAAPGTRYKRTDGAVSTVEYVKQTASSANTGWSAVPTFITGSATYDPGNLVDGDGATTTVTATGAALGDIAQVSFSLDLQGISLTAYVSAADTVAVRFQNETGGAIDLASGTIRVRVSKN